jgi:DNA ligase-1
MKAFAALYQRLDRSTATLDKRAALVDYFRQAGAHDAAWALYLLSGGKVGGARRKIAASGELRAWIADDPGCRLAGGRQLCAGGRPGRNADPAAG